MVSVAANGVAVPICTLMFCVVTAKPTVPETTPARPIVAVPVMLVEVSGVRLNVVPAIATARDVNALVVVLYEPTLRVQSSELVPALWNVPLLLLSKKLRAETVSVTSGMPLNPAARFCAWIVIHCRVSPLTFGVTTARASEPLVIEKPTAPIPSVMF